MPPMALLFVNSRWIHTGNQRNDYVIVGYGDMFSALSSKATDLYNGIDQAIEELLPLNEDSIKHMGIRSMPKVMAQASYL